MRMLFLIMSSLALLTVAVPAFAGDLAALDKAVKAWSEEASVPLYRYAFVDLNDDGAEDAVVMMTGSYCGTGGCSVIILQGVPGGFKFVSSSTICNEPVLLLSEKRHGWHTLSVLAAGGGIKRGGQVLMRYDGSKYPLNPSMQPKARSGQLKGAQKLTLSVRG